MEVIEVVLGIGPASGPARINALALLVRFLCQPVTNFTTSHLLNPGRKSIPLRAKPARLSLARDRRTMT